MKISCLGSSLLKPDVMSFGLGLVRGVLCRMPSVASETSHPQPLCNHAARNKALEALRIPTLRPSAFSVQASCAWSRRREGVAELGFPQRLTHLGLSFMRGLNLPVRDHELLRDTQHADFGSDRTCSGLDLTQRSLLRHAWLARQSIGTCGYHGTALSCQRRSGRESLLKSLEERVRPRADGSLHLSPGDHVVIAPGRTAHKFGD